MTVENAELDTLDFRAALAAVGAAPCEDDSDFDSELMAWTPALAELIGEVAPVVPSVSIWSAIEKELVPALPLGYTVLGRDDSKFKPTPAPGVTMRMLNIDRERGQFSCLMRFAPGARMPGHRHASAEECIVLEGSLWVGGVRMRAGDYQRVEAGVDHVEQWSDTGALAFITAPLELLDHRH